MFDAIDPLKFVRAQALKQTAIRPASPSPMFGANPQAKLQTGPAADVFTSSKTASDIKTPAAVPKSLEAGLKTFSNLRPSATAFLQSLKDIIPNRNQPVRIEKAIKPEFSAMSNATQKTPPSAKETALGTDNLMFGKAAEKTATVAPKPAANQFSNINEKLQKKNISAFGAALPLASIGLLAIPVAAPATLIVKPSLINQIVAALPATLP